ncbi:MAG: hypothetical protein Q9209_001029 [Squamulea sp. 1 TL-2023]
MAPDKATGGLLQVGGLLAAIVMILVVIGLIWYFLGHWGWWRLQRPGPRPVMVRTWHGWVDSGKTKNERTRNRLKKLPPCIPRTTKTDYSWIFWDPTGKLQRKFYQDRQKSLIRYLPQWMRSSPYGSAESDTNNDRDIEALESSEVRESHNAADGGNMGTLAFLGRRWHRRWRRTTTWARSSDTYVVRPDHDIERQPVYHPSEEQAMLNDSVTTIRTRRPRKHDDSGYELDSEDVVRATNTQLLIPSAAANLLQLFRTPSVQTSPLIPFVDSRQCLKIQPSHKFMTELPPPHQLRDNQYHTEIYLKTQGRQHDRSSTSYECQILSSHCPPKRSSTWTYSSNSAQVQPTSESPVDAEDYVLPHSASAVSIDLDTESIDRFSYEEPTIHVPRKRGGTKSTFDSTASAENMSIVDVPFRDTQRVSEVDAKDHESFDPQAYEEDKEADNYEVVSDTGSFGSVRSSRVGST